MNYVYKMMLVVAGVAIGAWVGFSGWLCPDGSCALTGTWFGGAAIGGFIGLMLTGRGCAACAILPNDSPSTPHAHKQ